jgi:hypothetical protein
VAAHAASGPLQLPAAIRSRSGAQAGVPAAIIGFRARKATFGAAQTSSCRETAGTPNGGSGACPRPGQSRKESLLLGCRDQRTQRERPHAPGNLATEHPSGVCSSHELPDPGISHQFSSSSPDSGKSHHSGGSSPPGQKNPQPRLMIAHPPRNPMGAVCRLWTVNGSTKFCYESTPFSGSCARSSQRVFYDSDSALAVNLKLHCQLTARMRRRLSGRT